MGKFITKNYIVDYVNVIISYKLRLDKNRIGQ